MASGAAGTANSLCVYDRQPVFYSPSEIWMLDRAGEAQGLAAASAETGIPHFKRVNDTRGHLAGDKVLIQVSDITKSSIRISDIAARWGGEELAIYLLQVGVEQANLVAEQIRNCVLEETNPRVTVSCGISDWHHSDERVSVEHLFYRSDMALYRAKRAGRNRVKQG